MQFERIYKICTHIQVKQEIQCDDNLIFIRITNGGEMSLSLPPFTFMFPGLLRLDLLS